MNILDATLTYGLNRLAQQSFPGVASLGHKLGKCLWYLLPSRRKLAIDNMVKHLNLTPEQATALAKENFQHTGQSFLETVLNPQFSIDSPLLTCNQPDYLEHFFTASRPFVAVTAHLGAWELLAGITDRFVPKRPCIVVVRNYKNASLTRITTKFRSVHGLQVVGHREAAGPVMEVLRHNGLAVFLADHNTTKSDAIFLPFLNDMAAVNKGPALLAIRAKAIVWPTFIYRQGSKYTLDIDPPLDTLDLTGSISSRVATVAQFYTQAIARAVQAHPEQWFWMHNRWKTRAE